MFGGKKDPKRKDKFTPQEKIAYYKKRANDRSLSPTQQTRARCFCQGVHGANRLFNNGSVSSFNSYAADSDPIVASGYLSGFIEQAKVILSNRTKKPKK
jgi:hypothetical protein